MLMAKYLSNLLTKVGFKKGTEKNGFF